MEMKYKYYQPNSISGAFIAYILMQMIILCVFFGTCKYQPLHFPLKEYCRMFDRRMIRLSLCPCKIIPLATCYKRASHSIGVSRAIADWPPCR